MRQRLHTILYEEVGEAVRPLAHKETNWSQGEMVKRIVRYIWKAATNEELLTMPFDLAVEKFVQGAMASYGGSCGERAWFYDLELGQVFGRAAWEILTASLKPQRVVYRAVVELADREFQSWLDQTLQNKAMWIAVESVFQESKIQTKVFTSLQKTYRTALDLALQDTRPVEDLQRLKEFMKKWMEDSLARSWSALGDAVERILTEDTCVRLFRHLIAPFGPSHPFSCVPAVLTEAIGRPPDDWNFIQHTVRGLFRQWRVQAADCSGAKRRKKASRAESPEPAPPPAAPAGRAAATGARAGGRAAAAAATLPPPPPKVRRKVAAGLSAAAAAALEEVEPLDDEVLEEEEEEEPLLADEDDDRGVGPEEAEGEEAREDLSRAGDAADDDEDVGGHPACTSQEDCQGTPDDVLIRHILNGKEADIYCASCWQTFKMQNPLLDGVELS